MLKWHSVTLMIWRYLTTMQKTAKIAWRFGLLKPTPPKSQWNKKLSFSKVSIWLQQSANMLVWETILGFSWVPQLQYQTSASSHSCLLSLFSFNPSSCFSCHPHSGTSKSTMGDQPQLRQCAQCSSNPRRFFLRIKILGLASIGFQIFRSLKKIMLDGQ